MSTVVPHNRPTVGEAEVAAVAAAAASGQWAQGERVAELERRLATAAGVAHAVGVASGSAALRLSLRALGVVPGHSVLVPAYSCVALPNAVLWLGAVPVAVDVEPVTWNIDPADAAAVTDEHAPSAVLAVHTFGAPAATEALEALGVPAVEDCSHAFGPATDQPAFGGRTRVAVLSLYATKLLGAGEGGAVLTGDSALETALRDLRDYTDRPPDGLRLNDKLNELAAALALAQLQRLDEMVAARRRLARRYGELLAGLVTGGRLNLPADSAGRIWYRYAVELIDRDAADIAGAMRAEGVHAALPICDWRGEGVRAAPVADRAYRRVLSLPLYPTLDGADQERVVAVLTAALDA